MSILFYENMISEDWSFLFKLIHIHVKKLLRIYISNNYRMTPRKYISIVFRELHLDIIAIQYLFTWILRIGILWVFELRMINIELRKYKRKKKKITQMQFQELVGITPPLNKLIDSASRIFLLLQNYHRIANWREQWQFLFL